MAEDRFDIIFSGGVRAGADPEQVKANVARLFKTKVAAIEHLFSGKRYLIKGGVDRATAVKYHHAMEQAGAICEVRDVQPEQVLARTRAAPPQTAPARGALAEAGLAPPGTTLVESRACVRPVFDLRALSLAAVGVDLVDRITAEQAPLPDVSALRLDPAGVDLVPPRSVPEPVRPAAGAMSVAPLGADLVERRPSAPLPLPDISALALAPPGQPLAEQRAGAPPPPPETRGLSLEPRSTVFPEEA